MRALPIITSQNGGEGLLLLSDYSLMASMPYPRIGLHIQCASFNAAGRTAVRKPQPGPCPYIIGALGVEIGDEDDLSFFPPRSDHREALLCPGNEFWMRRRIVEPSQIRQLVLKFFLVVLRLRGGITAENPCAAIWKRRSNPPF
jgi:hypothetical protein